MRPPMPNPYADMTADANWQARMVEQMRQADWSRIDALMDAAAADARRRDLEGRTGPYVPVTPKLLTGPA